VKLRYRLTLLIGFAALVPLLFTAFAATRIANTYHLRQTKEVYSKRADALAMYTASWFDSHLQGLLRSVNVYSVASLDAKKQTGVLQTAYLLFDAVNIAVLMDQDGNILAGPVYEGRADRLENGHESVSTARLSAFLDQSVLFEKSGSRKAPETLLPQSQKRKLIALGMPYAPPDSGGLVLPVSVRAEDSGHVVALELSLRALETQYRAHSGGEIAAVLLGPGNAMLGDSAGLVYPETTPVLSGLEGELQYTLSDGTEILASFASVGIQKWSALVALPRSVATEAGREIQSRTWFMYLLAIVLAVGLGLLGAKQIARPVVRLREAAFQVAEGNWGLRVDPEGSKEVVQLASAFNFLSRRLKKDQEEIEAKNAEIQAFNVELQERVEQRTQELRESQERLVESSRMAAVAQMGAGLAHELNNPVAGILGLAQVAKIKGGADEGVLDSIEEQAQRCRTILSTLSRFTSGERGEKTPTDLALVFAHVVELTSGVFLDAGVSIKNEVHGPLMISIDSAFFGQAMTQLLKSLRAELAVGGAIRIQAEENGPEVRVRFVLEGELRPRGDDWLATGMGFWVARYAVSEHGGQLEESEGTTRLVEIVMPLETA